MSSREGSGISGGQIIEMPMLLKSPWKQGIVPILTDVLKAWKFAGEKIRL